MNVKLFWVNGAEEIQYYELGPGDVHDQQTYAGEKWSVRTGSGELLQQVEGQKKTLEVNITGKSEDGDKDEGLITLPPCKGDYIWDHGTLFIRGIDYIPKGMKSAYTGFKA